MRFESRANEFLSDVSVAFRRSIDDAADHAKRNRSTPSDTHAETTGPMSGRIGSDKPYALAQERGAFIRPTRARALKFNDGTFRMRARIRAKHMLRNAAKKWPGMLDARLREAAR